MAESPTKVKLIAKKLAPQFDLTVPETRLIFAILIQALEDSNGKNEGHQRTSREYLNSEMFRNDMTSNDINPSWVLSIVDKIGVDITLLPEEVEAE